ALGELGERAEIAIVLREHGGEIVGQTRVDRLQVDDVRTLDHAEAEPGLRFESDNLHGVFPLISAPHERAGDAGALLDYFAGAGKGRQIGFDLILRSVRRTRLEGWPQATMYGAILRDARFAGSSG